MKKIPQRTCVICQQKFDKRDLMRIVADKSGRIFYDPTGKANGRGAYICQSPACQEQFLNKNYLERTFKRKVEKDVVDEVRQQISEKTMK
ncbi:YlxR family protein [Eubacteriaceae bacterium ES3]|nr:YlxR family protein [Eubacteriaceae bacterium ES3]